MISIRDFQFNPYMTNCYLLWDESRECVICDPGMCSESECRRLDDFIAAEGLRPVALILTHGHDDHTAGVTHCLRKYGIKAYMSLLDRPAFPAIDVHEEDRLSFGSHELIAIACPGHTPGGVAWLCIEEKLLLSGDTLFKGSIGRTDLEGGDYDALMETLRGKLMSLAGDIEVLPGHGPRSTIAEEAQTNPFLLPFNEPFDLEELG